MARPGAIIAGAKATRTQGPGGARPTPAPQSSMAPGVGQISPLAAQLANEGGYARAYGNFLPRPTSDFTQGAFGPFSPILPVPVDQPPPGEQRPEPRRFQYQVGWNLPVGEPGAEGIKLCSFGALRTLADLYSVARAAIEVRKNEIRGLAWDITPTTEAAKAYQGNPAKMADFGKRRAEAMKFFSHPDPNYFSWTNWIDALLEEVFVFDALSLYLRPKWGRGRKKGLLGSDLDSLQLLNGATIRPLLDMQGATPRPPAPAYQQYLYGVPRSDYMTMITQRDIDDGNIKGSELNQYGSDQLLYIPQVPRTWTPYGFPPIERALIPIQSGLQKQAYQLNYFREGTVPAVFISPGDTNMTPNQIRELQDALNAIAGDPAWHHKIIVLPPGSHIDPMHQAQLADQFDEIVMNQVLMAFDVQPMELGISPKVSTTQSPGAANQMAKMAQNAQQRNATKPLLNYLCDIFEGILHRVCGQDDMQFTFEGLQEEEDQEQVTSMLSSQINIGLRSIDEGREELHLQPWGLPETSEPIMVTPTGPVPLAQAVQQAAAAAGAAVAGHNATQNAIQSGQATPPALVPSVQQQSQHQLAQQQMQHQQAQDERQGQMQQQQQAQQHQLAQQQLQHQQATAANQQQLAQTTQQQTHQTQQQNIQHQQAQDEQNMQMRQESHEQYMQNAQLGQQQANPNQKPGQNSPTAQINQQQQQNQQQQNQKPGTSQTAAHTSAQGAMAVTSKKPAGGTPQQNAQQPQNKALYNELQALSRHLSKGRDIRTWIPVHIPGHILTGIQEDLGKGIAPAEVITTFLLTADVTKELAWLHEARGLHGQWIKDPLAGADAISTEKPESVKPNMAGEGHTHPALHDLGLDVQRQFADGWAFHGVPGSKDHADFLSNGADVLSQVVGDSPAIGQARELLKSSAEDIRNGNITAARKKLGSAAWAAHQAAGKGPEKPAGLLLNPMRDAAFALRYHADLLNGAELAGRDQPLPDTRESMATAAKLADDMKSGIAVDKRPVKGLMGDTHLITFNNGSRWVRKTDGMIDQDREILSSRVSDAIGAGAPEVIPAPGWKPSDNQPTIWEPMLPGTTAVETMADNPNLDLNKYYRSPEGKKIGLLDHLLNNQDRNNGNWLIGPDDKPEPIDHGTAYFDHNWAPQSEFSKGITSSSFTPQEWDQFQQNLQNLQSSFESMGHLDWHQQMMDNLQAIRNTPMDPGTTGFTT